jgi:cellobiose-specific phosphotransferase system component IIA
LQETQPILSLLVRPLTNHFLYPLTSSDRGQGLNHCISDAVNFVAAIKGVQESNKSLDEAVSAYDAELVQRGSDEVKTSKMSAIFVHDFKKFMDAPVLKKGYVKTELK